MIKPYVKFIMICFFVLIFFIKTVYTWVFFKSLSRLTIIMCLVFYCKTSSRHTIAMLLHQTYCFQKWVDPQLYGAKISPISNDKTIIFFRICLMNTAFSPFSTTSMVRHWKVGRCFEKFLLKKYTFCVKSCIGKVAILKK